MYNFGMGKNTKIPEILLITRPLTPPWDEASKNFAYLLAKNLDNCRFHILVGEYDSKLPKHITQHVIYRGSYWNTLQKTKLVLKLFLLLKRYPAINTVHFLFTPTSFNTRVLKNLVGSPALKVIQTIACIPESKKEKINSLLFAEKFIVYSKYTKSQIAHSRNGVNLRDKTVIIPPFIDLSQFSLASEKERNYARNKWKVDKKDKVILYPGEYSRLNAMEILIESFSTIKTKLPEAKLFIACRIKQREDEKIEKKFKKTISLAGLSSSVYFIGKVRDIRELYKASDLTVFPVKSMEGKFDFPFVLLESLACGTPILTSDAAALPEIWNENKKYLDKFVFPAGDADILAKKCIRILKQDRKKYEKELNKFVAERFEKKLILEKYSALYK